MIKRIYTVITLYIICLFLIFWFKPAMMFDSDGNIKHFNYEENDQSSSLLNIELVLSVLAIFCYFVVLAAELILLA
jgi:Ca2+/Na+ antiporter